MSLRRGPRRCRNPFWTGHTGLERGLVLHQSSQSASSLSTRSCKKQEYVLRNNTGWFCLLHLTECNLYENKRTLTAESWWESRDEIIPSQKFMPPPQTPRAQKYTKDPQWAWWISEQSPKCSVQVISLKLLSKMKQPNEKMILCIKVLVTEYEKSKETTWDFWFPVPGLACSMYVLERNRIYSYPWTTQCIYVWNWSIA